jgi:enamine deaminase RidA (YjgF/YER057c/UK114 family)
MRLSTNDGFTTILGKGKSKPPPSANVNSTENASELESGENSQLIVSNVKLEFQKKSETPLYQRVGALMSRLKTRDENLQILFTIAFEKTANPITEGKNVPPDEENFRKYFANKFEGHSTVTFFARIQSTKRISEIKRSNHIFEYLKEWKIYMKYNQLKAIDITAVAWVYDQHPDAISRNELTTRMVQMLPGRFDQFQLTARNVSHTRGSNLRTRGWTIEMARADAKTKLGDFMKTFHANAEITMVPLMDPKAWDKSGTMSEQFYYGQNKMLSESVIIKVDGLQGLDEFHEDENKQAVTLREIYLRAPGVFKSISQFNSKRVCFVTNRAQEEKACALIDDLLDNLIPSMPTEEKSKHTFPGRKPIRVGRREMPAEISLYMEQLPLKVIDLSHDNAGTAVSDTSTAYGAPPSRYGKRSYSQATQATQGTTQSTSSAISGVTPSVLSQASTEMDDQIKSALAKFEEQAKLMAEKQTEINQHKAASDTRFEHLENQFSQMLHMVTTNQDTQKQMQTVLSEQQTKLDTIMEMLEDMSTNNKGCPKSPTRKKLRATQGAEDSKEGMEEATEEPLEESKEETEASGGATDDIVPMEEDTAPGSQ